MCLTTRLLTATVILAMTALPAAAQGGKKAAPIKGVGTVELTAPAGQVEPIHSSGDKSYPAPDVVKLAVRSDGKTIAFDATLRNDPGAFATSILQIYFDTDNNAKTGGEETSYGMAGFEYRASLSSCVDYADQSSACAGGSDAKPIAYWAGAGLERVKGKKTFGSGSYAMVSTEYEETVSEMGFMGKKKGSHVPITAKKASGSIEYADLHVKPGQTIRIMVREEHKDAVYPTALLTLK